MWDFLILLKDTLVCGSQEPRIQSTTFLSMELRLRPVSRSYGGNLHIWFEIVPRRIHCPGLRFFIFDQGNIILDPRMHYVHVGLCIYKIKYVDGWMFNRPLPCCLCWSSATAESLSRSTRSPSLSPLFSSSSHSTDRTNARWHAITLTGD